MKGPGGRLKFDIRRLWECPACHRRDLTAGDIVTRLCTCSSRSDPPRQNWMKLIELKPVRPAPPPPSPPAMASTDAADSAVVAEVVSQPPPQATPTLPTGDNSTPQGS
jgi:hypothetical protein